MEWIIGTDKDTSSNRMNAAKAKNPPTCPKRAIALMFFKNEGGWEILV